MQARAVNRAWFSAFLGTIFLSAGIVVITLLVVHMLKGMVATRVAAAADFLVIASTPEFAFPPPTPIPTPTTPPLPVRLPPVRVVIPAIDLNTNIVQVAPEEKVQETGDVRWRWAAAEYAVGHHTGSGYPGAGTNIILSGHNNSYGRVFQRLPDLKIGDQITLYTADEEFHYVVQYRTVVKYRGQEERGEWTLQTFAAPTDSERLTLFSCYPYTTNADRIVVVALPITSNNP